MTTGAPGTTDAELDRLAEEALRATAAEDAQLDTLAAELLSEGNSNGAPNGAAATVAPTASAMPTALPGAAASGMAALNSLMSRARGMRFSNVSAAAPGAAPAADPYAVLGIREAAIWRQVLANDAARIATPGTAPKAPSRSYRCDKSRVRALDAEAAAALAADAATEAAIAIKAAAAERAALAETCRAMAPAFLAEIERTLAARIATDKDFDAARFPAAARRFAL